MNDQATLRQFTTATESLRAEQFTAWRLGERESDELPLQAPLSLDDAVAQALATHRLHPGDTLAVLYEHAGRGKQTLWLHTIRKSTKNYRWRAAYDGGKPVKVCALEAKLICETAVQAFAPVPRFDALRDDAVGADRSLVVVQS